MEYFRFEKTTGARRRDFLIGWLACTLLLTGLWVALPDHRLIDLVMKSALVVNIFGLAYYATFLSDLPGLWKILVDDKRLIWSAPSEKQSFNVELSKIAKVVIWEDATSICGYNHTELHLLDGSSRPLTHSSGVDLNDVVAVLKDLGVDVDRKTL